MSGVDTAGGVKLALSVDEAAARIGVHPSTLRRMIRQLGVPHFRVGQGPRSQIKIPVRAFTDWMDAWAAGRTYQS